MLRFDFLARDQIHDIQIEHKGGAWRFLADGEVVAGKRHNKTNPLTPAKHVVDFLVKTGLPDGDVKATMTCTWQIKGAKWTYDMQLNGKAVQPAWSKAASSDARPLGMSPVELFGPPLAQPNPEVKQPVEAPKPAPEPPAPPPVVEEPPPVVEPVPVIVPPAEDENKDGLLEDWEKAWSPADDMYYYYNHKTGVRQWERPDFPDSPRMKGPPSPQDLPPGWEMAWSPADNQYYYYNRDTGVTTWERPVKPVEKATLYESMQEPEPVSTQAEPAPVMQMAIAEDAYDKAIEENPNPDSMPCCGYESCTGWSLW